MSVNPTHKHPLTRKGTSQAERYPTALGKDYVKIDERSFEDLIAQSAELSRYFNFFESTADIPDGDWSMFFSEIYDKTTKTVNIEKIEALKSNSSLAPHLGLFLSFLRLFQYSLEQLNGLTEQHLLFFYEKMLRLKKNVPIPPKVSLIGELAKDVETLFLPKGTLLKAGKNQLGEERYFATDQDFILNQAKIVGFKTLNFLGDKIRQRDISNSADGQGAEIMDDPKSWSAFGTAQDKITEIGFCISSPFLGVNEGRREITLTINNVNLDDFNVYISVESGWQNLQFAKKSEGIFSVVLESSFPKIAPLIDKIHGIKSDNLFPFLKFVIKESKSSRYFKYKSQLASIQLTLDCSNIRDLSVKNELGTIDVSKPFQPFGTTPNNAYSALFIGHPLIFNKYANPVNVYQNGTQVSSTNNLTYLNSGEWNSSKFNFYDNNFDKEYTINTKNNYLKLKYTGSISSNNFAQIKVTNLKEGTQKIEIIPPTNNTIIWQNLSVSSKITIKQTNTDVFNFYHLHPFDLVKQNTVTNLLPSYDKLSYFLIGVEKLHYGQSLSLHFELLEGSGNQDLVHPKAIWYVKQGDQILRLNTKEIVRDTTNRLMQSGIVQFALEKNRILNANNLENDVLWLVATCRDNELAIPEFLSVLPQAFTATYIIPDSQTIEDIVPESIKKTVNPIVGLKKIAQPYKSFGGRLHEDREAFVLRSSERLRHKGVAIQIFDYERLLLSKFPFLYQVKCISHSTTSSQQSPGDVLIVVVPKLKQDRSQIDLKPRVSIGNREDIKQFLEKITSPFVRIDVRNPNYQEIQVEVNVKYLPQYEPEKEYYNTVLNQRLQSYISPWIDNKIGVEFNSISYKSKYINFIEEQEFVDNITLFNLYINGVKVKDKIESEREDVVFTSVRNHIIRNEDLC